jgi:serine protease inhibitor
LASQSSHLLPGKAALAVTCFAALLLGSAGCGSKEAPPVRPEKLLSTAKPKDPRPQDIHAIREFSLRAVLEQAKVEGGSGHMGEGWGLARQLSMTALAAEGPTLASISAGMKLPDMRPDRLATAHASLARRLNVPSSGITSSSSAWAVWPIAITPEFQQSAASDLGIHVKRLGSAGEGATRQVNDWVKMQLAPALPLSVELDKEAPLYFLQVFRASGAWKTPFDPQKTRHEFFGSGDGQMGVSPLMQGSPNILSGKTFAGDVAVLEMADRPWQVILIKPSDANLQKSADLILKQGVEPLLKGLSRQQTLVFLPKTVLRSRFSLEAPLRSLGLSRLVDPGADLRYMSLEIQSLPSFRWEQIMEISFDEKGLGTPEGAAAPPQVTQQSRFVLRLDRPFLWILWHPKEQLALAGGSVTAIEKPKGS